MDESYLQAVMEHYSTHERATAFLSPKDLQVVRDWWEQGVPLEIVRTAIDRHLLKRDEDRRREHFRHVALASCNATVKRIIAERIKETGFSPAVPPSSLGRKRAAAAAVEPEPTSASPQPSYPQQIERWLGRVRSAWQAREVELGPLPPELLEIWRQEMLAVAEQVGRGDYRGLHEVLKVGQAAILALLTERQHRGPIGGGSGGIRGKSSLNPSEKQMLTSLGLSLFTIRDVLLSSS